MGQIELACKTREVLGKKVAALRRQGITPVHLFGHGIDSQTLECDSVQLHHVLAKSGSTRLIDLKIDKVKQPKKVLVREVQRNAIRGDLLHVDFYQVRMEEKVRLEIPIILVGEAPALKQKGNVLAHELTSLNIECFPDVIPNKIEVDLSVLTEADQAIHVKDIKVASGITIIDHPDQLIARISVPRVKEEEVVAAPVAEGEATAEAAEGAAAGAETKSE
ncbi:MAG: 50S ribosomal protein L25 [Dehalococcoidales bacterium]|nr:50S ribosomal protein L25 [Dehalococcoidales bacterium]